MQTILTQKQILNSTAKQTANVFGKKISVMGKIFGCWHKNLTRPFTSERGSYRACLECGARRRFDDQSFKTTGAFYYPPAISLADNKR